MMLTCPNDVFELSDCHFLKIYIMKDETAFRSVLERFDDTNGEGCGCLGKRKISECVRDVCRHSMCNLEQPEILNSDDDGRRRT